MSHSFNKNNPPLPPPRRQRTFNKENLEIEPLTKNHDFSRSLSASTSNLLAAQTELIAAKTKDNQTSQSNELSEISSLTIPNQKKVLRRSVSSQPYVATSTFDKIKLEATMLSIFNANYSPEDALQYNDGSTNVLPNFKLNKTMCPSCKEPDSSENLSNINLYPNEIFHSSNGSSNQSQMKVNYLDWSINAFKSMCIVETPEKISTNSYDNNTIAMNEIDAFIKEEDINYKDVLDLLQYEFGDNIYCQHLPAQDKELIQLLRKSSKEEKSIKLIDAEKTPKNQMVEKLVPSHEKNMLIPIQKNKHEHITRERRDSAIDELSSWFARPSNTDEQQN